MPFSIDFLDDGRVLDMLHEMHGIVKKLGINLSELPDWPCIRAGSEFLDPGSLWFDKFFSQGQLSVKTTASGHHLLRRVARYRQAT